MNAPTRSATQYATASNNIDALIARLQAARAKHAERAAAQPGNWGFTGDVQHLEQQLQDIVNGLGA